MHPNPPSCAAPLLLLSCALASSCATIRPQAEAVVVTDDPALVRGCGRTGPMVMSSPDKGRNEELFDLQLQALQDGGNTVLITSRSTTGSGTAFRCDPALPQEASVAPAVID